MPRTPDAIPHTRAQLRRKLIRVLKQAIVGMVPMSQRTALRYWKRRLAGEIEPELHWFLSSLRPLSVVADIGANMGNYTYAAVRRGHAVIAFEPLSSCLDELRAFASRHEKSVTIHGVAISDRIGDGILSVPFGGKQATGRATLRKDAFDEDDTARVKVPLATLDSLELPRLGGIKVDVEGHELAVLRGASNTIARDKPVLLIEFAPEWLGVSFLEAFEFMRSLGYEGYFLDNRFKERPVEEFEALTPDRIINTFLWRPT